MINEIKNADKKKKRFLSMFTAAFMTLTTLGSSFSTSADPASEVEGIKNVTGDSAMKAELLDVPDAGDKFLGMAGDFTIFVKDKFTIPADASDIEGRLAAGGGIKNERGTYDIGSKYDGKGASVIVGGGTVEEILQQSDKGRRFAVTSDTDVDQVFYDSSIKAGNFFIYDGLIDFDAEFSKISRLSDEIAGYTATGEVVEQW
ncbi:MAG: choice-of-anchor A family protein, partial [Oscillospiraceae bacterium]|nr:choice-of-anchor A family protein [Oscillospiraceae bacterium]